MSEACKHLRLSLLHTGRIKININVRGAAWRHASSDKGPTSSDDKSNSTQSAVDHLAAETPANQHAGPGASDSVFLAHSPLLAK